MVGVARRWAWALLAVAALAGCADAPPGPADAAAARGNGLTRPWRTLIGGFIAPVLPTLGVQARPGTGMFVKLIAPQAVALRGQELVVADLASARIWRADLGFNTLTPVAGAAAVPGTQLLFGIDASVWVLDPGSRQVLRFGRDGRVLQTWRTQAAAPSAMALADGGATLLVADAGLAQWAELRSGGALALPVLPQRADGTRLAGVDALATGRDHLFALDRAAGVVHRVGRDGRVLESLGTGALDQPAAMVVDRFDRVWVLDASGAHVTVLRSGAAPRRLAAAELGAQQIGGIAVDDRMLAVTDRPLGQVLLHMLSAEAGP